MIGENSTRESTQMAMRICKNGKRQRKQRRRQKNGNVSDLSSKNQSVTTEFGDTRRRSTRRKQEKRTEYKNNGRHNNIVSRSNRNEERCIDNRIFTTDRKFMCDIEQKSTFHVI